MKRKRGIVAWYEFDTIAAISNGAWEGHGIVRISGRMRSALLTKYDLKKTLKEQPGHTIHYGHMRIQRTMAIDSDGYGYVAPKTFTREDVGKSTSRWDCGD